MRVNVYAEEMTDRIEIISKTIDGSTFTGLRFYLELPATVNGVHHQGPFMHRPGDDDSSAVTFWGKRDMRVQLQKALDLLDGHYACYGLPDIYFACQVCPSHLIQTEVEEHMRTHGSEGGVVCAQHPKIKIADLATFNNHIRISHQ